MLLATRQGRAMRFPVSTVRVFQSRGDLPGEEIVPCLSCFLLDVSWQDGRRENVNGQSILKRESTNEFFIAIRFRAPQTVIDMQHGYGKAEFPHSVEEEHGISAARNGHADAPMPIVRHPLDHV